MVKLSSVDPGIWIIIAVFTLIVLINASQSNKYRPFLERQAMKRNGLVRNFLVMYPTLEIPVEDRRAVVRVWAKTKNTPARVSLKCQIRELKDLRIVVKPITQASLFSKVADGVESKAAELSEFDQAFDSDSNDAEFLKTVLENEEVRAALRAMLEWNPFLIVEDGEFSLFVVRKLVNDQEYDRFIDQGTIILRKFIEVGRYQP